MTTREGESLRRELRRRTRGRGKRFEPELRQRIIAFARQRRTEGASWMAIATELGACFETVRRWCGTAATTQKLRRVEVIAASATDSSRAALAVVDAVRASHRGGRARRRRHARSSAGMILGTSRSVRVYAYPEPVDLRKGYDGLFGLVKQGLGRDPLSGDLFLFVNARRKGCKVLVWDGTGLCIFRKRLERGQFASLWRDDRDVVALTASELALFIEGCELVGHRKLSPAVVVPMPLGT